MSLGLMTKFLPISKVITLRFASPRAAILLFRAFATTDFGYLRLRREDYEKEDIVRWAKFLEAQEKNWSHVFVYFKHEKSGIGPQLAAQLIKELEAVDK